jgi:hypothetical protein
MMHNFEHRSTFIADLEMKKLPASDPLAWHSSAIEPMIADFPEPAGPDSHNTFSSPRAMWLRIFS